MGFRNFCFCKCDDCENVISVPCSKTRAVKTIRALGWAVSVDKNKCYCPACGEAHRQKSYSEYLRQKRN
jgi:hypothetical protein